MNLADLLLVTTRGDNPLRANTTGDTKPDEQARIPSFLTVESLTFPLGSIIVTACWKVLQAILGPWVDANATPFIIAVIIILALVSAKWTELGDAGKKVSAVAIGIVNAILLTAASVGVDLAFIGEAP